MTVPRAASRARGGSSPAPTRRRRRRGCNTGWPRRGARQPRAPPSAGASTPPSPNPPLRRPAPLRTPPPGGRSPRRRAAGSRTRSPPSRRARSGWRATTSGGCRPSLLRPWSALSTGPAVRLRTREASPAKASTSPGRRRAARKAGRTRPGGTDRSPPPMCRDHPSSPTPPPPRPLGPTPRLNAATPRRWDRSPLPQAPRVIRRWSRRSSR
mmetsp:Transcript_42334/g.113256  ORF Transcript_42334/g.113256 Transcript_42334/m.113256 type:complete len:211 (+) Transcript_42334:1079-1711(+)